MAPMENLKKNFKTVITPVVYKIESRFLVLGWGFRGGVFNGIIQKLPPG